MNIHLALMDEFAMQLQDHKQLEDHDWGEPQPLQFENAYIWFCRNSTALSMRKDVCFH